MKEKVIADPTVAGWEYDSASGYWMWSAEGGSIQDGDTEGQITTWEGDAWTPEDALVIDSATGDAAFSGTVDAGGFTVNGAPISGGGDFGSSITLEASTPPVDNRKFWLSVDSSGSLGIQALRDNGGGGGSFFNFSRSGNNVSRFQCIKSGRPVGYWDIASNTITAKDFIATSDERAKDNITTAPVGLIDSLKGREWDWKESGERGSGVVAQELEEVLPHLVHTDEEGMKSVAYNGLVAYLIEEVKALKAEVEALKS